MKSEQLRALTGQNLKVYEVLSTGRWLTLLDLNRLTGIPITSVSAVVRALRKPEFGSHAIVKRRRGPTERGLYEYRMVLDSQTETK